jgi:hypothetical protein
MDPGGERAEQDRRGDLDRQRRRPDPRAAGSAPGGRGKSQLPGAQQLVAAGRAAAERRFTRGNGVADDDGALPAASREAGCRQ